MRRYKTRPDPRQRVKPDDSLYEPEVDWEPLGKPYARTKYTGQLLHFEILEPYTRMVWVMHERNQRVIMIHQADGDFERELSIDS